MFSSIIEKLDLSWILFLTYYTWIHGLSRARAVPSWRWPVHLQSS